MMVLLRIRSIITKFQKLSWEMKLLHLEAFFYQLSIGLLLKIIPFKHIPALFPNPSDIKSATRNPEPATPNPQLQEIKQANFSIRHIIPWKNKCLVQSLSARKMLTRRGIQSQLSLGVLKDENAKTLAHAWLKSGDFEVVDKDGDYQELYLF